MSSSPTVMITIRIIRRFRSDPDLARQGARIATNGERAGGSGGPGRLDRCSISTRWVRGTARAWLPVPGSTRIYKQRLLADGTSCDRGAGLRRCARRAHGGGREHAADTQSHRLHACAHVIPGRFWGCRRCGTNRRRIVRARVIDPRGVLREFGLELSGETEVRVWDSTAELRYLVLPERPAGSENLDEEALRGAGDARQHDWRGEGGLSIARSSGVNGVHDMGGMQDFGPVHPNGTKPAFHAPWEGRVFAMI